MPRYCTHYWKQQTCRNAERCGQEGLELRYAGSNLFAQRGIAPGDIVYVVSMTDGKMLLIGRLRVEAVLNQSETEQYARQHLDGDDLWDATDHVVARPGDGTLISFRRYVPGKVARQLEFVSASDWRSLKRAAPDRLDTQTLRGVRELTESSARVLDRVLEAG